ncbi:MAG: HAD family hydrolase [Vicinamibacterales bacterium]
MIASPLLFSDAGTPRVPGVYGARTWRPTRGVILDLDNTLYPLGRYTMSGFAAVAAHVASTAHVPADQAYALLANCEANGQRQTAFQSLCHRFDLDAETIPVLIEVFRAHRPRIFLGNSARTLLQGLRADGWQTAVLTNGLPAVQARKAEALGLNGLVDHVLYAEQLAPGGKPARATFAAALRRLGTRAERTVCIGDDPRCDVAGARAAGMATVRITTSLIEVDPSLEADVVVESLDEVRLAASSLLEGVKRHAA